MHWLKKLFRNQYFICLWALLILLPHFVFLKSIIYKKETLLTVIFLLFFFAVILYSILLIVKLLAISEKKVVNLDFNAPFLAVIFLLTAILFINIDIIYKLDVSKFKYLGITAWGIIYPFFITLFIFIASLGIGEKFLKLLKVPIVSFPERALFSVGLGLGLIGFFTFLLAVFSLAYPAAIYGMFFFIIIISWKEIRNFLKNIFRKKIVYELNIEDVWKIHATTLLATIFLITFIYANANLLSASWDTLHQYLTFPSIYAKNHSLSFFPFHPHWGFPQQTEMLYLSGILAGGMKVPFIMNYFFMVLAWVGMGCILKKIANRNIFWIMNLVMSIPIILSLQSGYLKVELLFAFYMVLVFLAVYYYFHLKKEKNIFYLIAILLGIMMVIKYTGVFVALSLLIAAYFSGKRDVISVKNLVISGSIILIIFLPWAIKDWVYYHNPLYPLISGGKDFLNVNLGISGHRYFVENCREDMFFLADNMDYQTGFSFLSNFILLIKNQIYTYPINITNPGPWLLIFSPFLIAYFFKTKDAFIRFLYIFSTSFIIFWLLFLAGQSWYLLPAILALFIILGVVFDSQLDIDKNKFFKSLIISWLVFNLANFVLYGAYKEKIKYIRKEDTYSQAVFSIKDNYKVNSQYKWLKAWTFINKQLAQDSQPGLVYAFMDTQGYFIDDSNINYIPDFFGYAFRAMRDNGDVYPQLKKLGVKYIITENRYKKDIRTCHSRHLMETSHVCQTENAFASFIKEHGEPIFREGSVYVYLLK